MEGDQAGQTHALGQAAVVVVLVPRAVAQPGLVPAAGEVVQVEVVNERNVRNGPNRILVLKIPLNQCRITEKSLLDTFCVHFRARSLETRLRHCLAGRERGPTGRQAQLATRDDGVGRVKAVITDVQGGN